MYINVKFTLVKSVHRTACSMAIIAINRKSNIMSVWKYVVKHDMTDFLTGEFSLHKLFGKGGRKAAVKTSPATSKTRNIPRSVYIIFEEGRWKLVEFPLYEGQSSIPQVLIKSSEVTLPSGSLYNTTEDTKLPLIWI